MHIIAELKPNSYCIWSTVVDAPVFYGMNREELARYYRENHESKDDFLERMARVSKKGVSSHWHDNVEQLVRGNRAGPDEGTLSLEELREKYC